MKEISLPYKISGLVFVLSLCFMGFSLYQILTTDSKMQETLAEWDHQQSVAVLSDEGQQVVRNSQELPIMVENLAAADQQKPATLNTPEKGEVFGKIIIPKIEKEFPIVEGTGNKELEKGVGHYIGSAFPGEADNTVLAGHRDTVFRGLDQVKEGEQIILETATNRFVYEIYKHQIVDKNDRTVLVHSDKPILTLVTCYPFNYIGAAPERYILTAKLVEE